MKYYTSLCSKFMFMASSVYAVNSYSWLVPHTIYNNNNVMQPPILSFIYTRSVKKSPYRNALESND
jgi:hypothetical protein